MFSVTFLWAESPWGRARADCHELVAGLCGRREATRPAGAPGGSGQASFSKSRMVWGGSVSAIGAPSSPVQRELRERAARKGRPLTLRTGTSVSGSFSARIPCLDLHVPPGVCGGLLTQLSLPAVLWDVWAWNAGWAKPLDAPSWPPLPRVGDQPPWTPEPA